MRLFLNMSLLDNVAVAGSREKGESFWRVIAAPGVVQEQVERKKKRALELLEWGGLRDKSDELAANISYGEKKILALLRALSAEPRVLLLDEPTAGLPWTDVSRVLKLVRDLAAANKTIFLVEHNMEAVMDVSDRVIVLNLGKKIAEGPPSSIRVDRQVMEVYLGE
jgi:branched-chain amino acid transport system ATP-binding protein